jgi:lipopolysaccharide/colanic/teichoic acid biosynthesis glycosyltransferase
LDVQTESISDATADYLAGRRRNLRAKRLIDLVVVLATAPVWMSLVGMLWLLVKLSDPHAPALCWEERVGRLGRPFQLARLRTSTPVGQTGGEQRFTRIGAVLHSTHLDEMPQLFNVLAGTMSLVGPRPSTATRLPNRRSWWRGRHDALPGLTDLGQLQPDGLHGFDERARSDIAYIRSQSPLGDIRLILATVVQRLSLGIPSRSATPPQRRR